MTYTIAPVLGEATIQELREAVRGEIATPGDDGYADACRIWNGAHDDRRPALVVRRTGAADVIAAVGFARSNGLRIAVRGGGHSIAGFSTCDHGIVIDLAPMRGVRVDPAARRATVGGGAVCADVDRETQAHGLATTGGLVSSTGVAGFTLGGGIADLLGPMPYRALQTLIDPLWRKGIHAYFKATNLARLDDQLIDRLCKIHLEAPGPQCEIHVHQMGGAVGRVAEGATAFAERSMPFVLNAVTGWHDPDATNTHREWARTVTAAASDASTGRAYVNFLGDANSARTSYGDDAYTRLVSLKNAHDPTNAFQLNQNIDPPA